jgi:uncharacterized delta-60 repeat protein
VAVGSATEAAASGGQNFAVARYNADGSLDPGFGTGGKTTTDFDGAADVAFDLVIRPDGEIVVAGSSNGRFALAAYNPDGSLDSSFGKGGVVVTESGSESGASALVLRSDGRLLAAGSATDPEPSPWGFFQYDSVLACYNPDGSLYHGFGGGAGIVTNRLAGTINDIALRPDGAVVAAGSNYVGIHGETAFSFSRYHPDGTPDLTFGTDGRKTIGFGVSAESVALQSDGTIVSAGWGGTDTFFVARCSQDGKTGGTVQVPIYWGPGRGSDLVVLPDDSVVAAGFGMNANLGDFDFVVARLNSGLGLDQTFGTGGVVSADFSGPNDSVASVAVQADGKIVIAGSATVGAGTDFALMRFLGDAPPARVVGRQVFYNHSAFDGDDAEPGAADDNAIATDKSALLAGADAAPSFANVTGFNKGLNGIMVDIAGLPDGITPTLNDFAFGGAGEPVSITLRRGAGARGSDRVTLIWPDYNPFDASPVAHAVANGWLTVTVKPNAHTGLAAPDVFSFGNLIGETGDGGGAAGWRVNALDLGAVKAALNTTAAKLSKVDVNHDGRVNALDLGILKRNLNQSLPLPGVPVLSARSFVNGETGTGRRVADDVLA